MQPTPNIHPVLLAADIGSVLVILGAWLALIPPLAALAALGFYLIQIWESKTIQGWHARRQQKRESLKRLREKGLVEINHADASG